jgi:hypothetical protein
MLHASNQYQIKIPLNMIPSNKYQISAFSKSRRYPYLMISIECTLAITRKKANCREKSNNGEGEEQSNNP